MENTELAKIFYQIAEFLEMKGDNPFKIRAYQKGARVIEVSSAEVVGIDSINELMKIDGIGKSIAEKIIEIKKTGHCRKLEDLEKEFPPPLLELIGIPGMGPKKAAFLFKELKIKNIDTLEKYAREGKLRDLHGFGEKTEKNILEGIEFKKSYTGRIPIGQALPEAREIIGYLKKKFKVDLISEAGSLRRRSETIGDIDMLVAYHEAARVMEAFTKLSNVKKVIAKGRTKSSVLTVKNLQVDLRVVPQESYGAALQYFTGSKDHNIALRKFAESRGYKVNEYGVFKIKGNKKIAGKTEESVYKVLGLQFIPPEIRLTGGEIELAQKNEIPKLIKLEDLKGDLHCHSNLTDGANTLEELAEFVSKIGFQYLGITDHSRSLRVANGMSIEGLRKKNKQIDKINEKHKRFKLLKGTEADILPDGSIDYPDSVLEELDFTVASVHSHFKMKKEEMTRRIIKAMQNPYVHIIAHPSGRLLGVRKEYELDWDEIFKQAYKTRTVLEINAFPDRLDLTDLRCKIAKDMGVYMAINTDAHNVHHFEWLEYGIGVARRGWLEPENVINTFSLENLLKFLKSKKVHNWG